MAQAGEPPRVKLICGMISARRELFDRVTGLLGDVFGPVDLFSEVMDFDLTHYYDEQMGAPLYRQFVSFEPLVRPDVLAEAKLKTNRIEAELARDVHDRPRRPINLDPGYVELAKLVLASMKNFSHRIYLGRGVYGEVTLMFRDGRWKALPWTFPDYASCRYDPFLTEVRGRLRDRPAKGERI